VSTAPEFKTANAGFARNIQLIDVPDFQGKGESCPTPHFFQNLGEAEYVVAVFQYMCLIGYPPSKISILTTYNGQKQLIQDIINQRCQHRAFGRPACVSTVDKFQGQQNDYVLLSLVRTEAVGHIRDVRRLVVALSRVRLGLYVFCRKSLFTSCYELSPAFNRLITQESEDDSSGGGSNSSKLELVAGEGFPSQRRLEQGSSLPAASGLTKHIVEDVTSMGVLVFQMVQQSEMSGSGPVEV
jgi:intron-binding protein aquarius